MESAMNRKDLPSFVGRSKKRLRPVTLTSNCISPSCTPLLEADSIGSCKDSESAVYGWIPSELDQPMGVVSTPKPTLTTALNLIRGMPSIQTTSSSGARSPVMSESEVDDLISINLPMILEMERALEQSLPSIQKLSLGTTQALKNLPSFLDPQGRLVRSPPRSIGSMVQQEQVSPVQFSKSVENQLIGSLLHTTGGMDIEIKQTL